MLTTSSTLRVASFVRTCARRNLATSYVAAAATASDPIQQLFVDKVGAEVNYTQSELGQLQGCCNLDKLILKLLWAVR